MARTRDAIDTITGYFYQFDYYILQFLSSNNENASICLEGIEDIDINSCDETTAVQCKYYSKTEYNHSVIAKPIRFMFQDFMKRVSSGNYINYSLYGNYSSGQDKYPKRLDVDFLKTNFLKYTHDKKQHKLYEELNATDEQLENFILRLKVDVNAISYEEQQKSILKKLQEIFRCDLFEAEYYFYNNALRLVKDTATKQDINQRKYTKQHFIEKINTKNVLFNNWFMELKGINQYCKAIRRQYFTQSNVSPIERIFLLEADHIISDLEIVEVIIKIAKNWSRLSKKEISPFCPYVYLHGISSERLIEIKKNLVHNGIKLIDGYDFLGADFSLKSIAMQANGFNGIEIKFLNEINILENYVSNIHTKKEIFEFFLERPYFSTDYCINKMIPIKTTKNVMDII